MDVFVTGGTGRLGRRLVRRLAEKGLGVIVLTSDSKSARELFSDLPSVSFVNGDLLSVSEDVLVDSMRGCGTVFHLAALLDYSASEEKMMAVNAEGTRKIAKAAEKALVRRFVLMSSTSLYHEPKLPIDEKQTPTPVNAYGRSKLAAEKELETTKLDYIAIRAPAIYGPGFDEGFAKVIELVKKGKMPLIGKAQNHIAFIHADDVVSALMLAAECRASREAFIITSGEVMTQEECLNGIADELNAKRPALRLPEGLLYLLAWLDGLRCAFGRKRMLRKEYVRGLVEDRIFDISKARKILGYSPRVSFKEGIRGLIDKGVK